MAAKFVATTSVTATDRVVAVQGTGRIALPPLPAVIVKCTCDGCHGRAVVVPSMTVNALTGTPRKVDTALHNLVAQARLLGFPAA